MSVGGEVTEVIVQDGRVYIDTDDSGDKCAIFVEKDKNSVQVKLNDVVWWQGYRAFWTTADRKTVVERTLFRRGTSGVSRPTKTA
ncbi:MAG: hypothetical protein JKX72_02510 [Robiginitomaculum sp.]|nr:hypothetical protein [Robiginitomaculum sp.]